MAFNTSILTLCSRSAFYLPSPGIFCTFSSIHTHTSALQLRCSLRALSIQVLSPIPRPSKPHHCNQIIVALYALRVEYGHCRIRVDTVSRKSGL